MRLQKIWTMVQSSEEDNMNWKPKAALAGAVRFTFAFGGTQAAHAAPPKDACSLRTAPTCAGVSVSFLNGQRSARPDGSH